MAAVGLLAGDVADLDVEAWTVVDTPLVAVIVAGTEVEAGATHPTKNAEMMAALHCEEVVLRIFKSVVMLLGSRMWVFASSV